MLNVIRMPKDTITVLNDSYYLPTMSPVITMSNDIVIKNYTV